MARTPRNEVSRARRGSARGERRTVRSPVNGPVAASSPWVQQNGTHLGAPSDIMGSSLVPSSGLEVQPEVQPGWLADGLNVHQPMYMGTQPSRTDFDVLTLAESEAIPRLEGINMDAVNLENVFPLELGNQSSESIRDSPIQSYRSLASVVTCGASNLTPNAVNAAPAVPTAPTASDYDFPAMPCLGPVVISPLPEILPLEEAEELHMLAQLLPPEQDRSLENASSLSLPNQLYQPNHWEGPMQMVNYDPPCRSPMSWSVTPLGEMVPHSVSYPQGFPSGNWLQQISQQPLTDLVGDMLGSAPFHSSLRNEPCAMGYQAGYPPSANSTVITDIVPNTVQAAPTVHMAPFDSLGQAGATSDMPNSALVPNGSAHSASANQSNVATRRVTAGRDRVPRNGLPRSRQATVGKLRHTRSAPTPVAPPATMNLAEVMLGRIETRRQNHMRSERRKRQQMNELYASIRHLLRTAERKIRNDKATILLEITNAIERSRDEINSLQQQLKHSQQVVAALCNVNPSVQRVALAAARLLATEGYTCVDPPQDPSALTAVTTLPAAERFSGLASFLGTNVAINYCHDCYTLTISSPHLGQAIALLEPMLVAIQEHHLEVLFAAIITTGNTHIYTLQCEASPDAALLRNNLLRVLQDIVDNFPSSSSSQDHHG